MTVYVDASVVLSRLLNQLGTAARAVGFAVRGTW